MIERKMDNRTSQNRKSSADRTKSRLLGQQGATRCALDMELKGQKKKSEDSWNANPELPPTSH